MSHHIYFLLGSICYVVTRYDQIAMFKQGKQYFMQNYQLFMEIQ